MQGQELRYDIVGDSAGFQRAAAAAQQAGVNATRQITAGMKESMAAARGMQAQIERSTATIRQMVGVNDNLAKYRRQNLTFQLFDVGQTIGTTGVLRTLIQQGPQIVQIYAGQGGVRTALADTRGILGSLLGQFGRFGPVVAAAAAAAGVGLVGLQHEINKTSDVQVSLGQVFKATWQTAADGVYDLMKPAIDEISPWIESVWKDVVDATAFAVNDFVGHVVGGFEFIKEAGLQLPEVFGDIAFRIADKFYSGVSEMIRETLTDINSMIERINYALADTGVQLKALGRPTFGLDKDRKTQIHIENPYAGAADKPIGAFNDALGRDYAGEWFDAIRDKAVELAKASKDAGKAMKDAAAEAVDPWAGLRDVSDGVKEEMREIARQARETARFWSGTANSFMSEFTSGMEQGKNAWESFADAAVNSLNRIADELTKEVFDNIFHNGSGGGLLSMFGLGSGGGLQMFPGGMGSATPGYTPWAKGGVFERGISGFSNTIVTRPTPFRFASGAGLMGEAGPEGILPLRRNSRGQLGVMAANHNSRISIAVYNNGQPVDATAKQSTDGNGNRLVEIFLEKKIEDQVTRPSASTNRSLRQSFGLSQQVVRR